MVTTTDFHLELVPGKGPLAVFVIAMFGDDSFIGTRTRGITAGDAKDTLDQPASRTCSDYPPFALLNNQFTLCAYAGSDKVKLVGDWLSMFDDTEQATRLLSKAAFVVNQATLTQEDDNMRTLYVANWPGVRVARPDMSTASVICLSLLIFAHLTSLLILSLLGSMQTRWTEALDAHAMLKFGASLSDRAVSGTGGDPRDPLDMPGWAGDSDPDAPIGKLAVGAAGPLRWRRDYQRKDELSL